MLGTGNTVVNEIKSLLLWSLNYEFSHTAPKFPIWDNLRKKKEKMAVAQGRVCFLTENFTIKKEVFIQR